MQLPDDGRQGDKACFKSLACQDRQDDEKPLCPLFRSFPSILAHLLWSLPSGVLNFFYAGGREPNKFHQTSKTTKTVHT